MLGRMMSAANGRSPGQIAAAVGAYGCGIYIAYEIFRPVPAMPSSQCRCCTFNELAPNYDAEIEKDEKSSGILKMRGEMIALARGRTLEIGGGTGRNLTFYTDAVFQSLPEYRQLNVLKCIRAGFRTFFPHRYQNS